MNIDSNQYITGAEKIVIEKVTDLNGLVRLIVTGGGNRVSLSIWGKCSGNDAFPEIVVTETTHNKPVDKAPVHDNADPATAE